MKVILDEIYTFGMKVVLDELVFYLQNIKKCGWCRGCQTVKKNGEFFDFVILRAWADSRFLFAAELGLILQLCHKQTCNRLKRERGREAERGKGKGNKGKKGKRKNGCSDNGVRAIFFGMSGMNPDARKCCAASDDDEEQHTAEARALHARKGPCQGSALPTSCWATLQLDVARSKRRSKRF